MSSPSDQIGSGQASGASGSSTGGDWARTAQSTYQEAKQTAADSVEQARQAVKDSSEQAWRTVTNSTDQYWQAMMDEGRQVCAATETYVRENPWQAIGVAAGAGVLIGLLLTRR
jgi:ElaB/YqjD/DUF883 family membrane-anchored ribosome-binding protein